MSCEFLIGKHRQEQAKMKVQSINRDYGKTRAITIHRHKKHEDEYFVFTEHGLQNVYSRKNLYDFIRKNDIMFAAYNDGSKNLDGTYNYSRP